MRERGLKDIITDVRVKMYKEGITTNALAVRLGVDPRTLQGLFYRQPNEKGKLLTFVKLLNYLKEV